jgi:hypothetical protein
MNIFNHNDFNIHFNEQIETIKLTLCIMVFIVDNQSWDSILKILFIKDFL